MLEGGFASRYVAGEFQAPIRRVLTPVTIFDPAIGLPRQAAGDSQACRTMLTYPTWLTRDAGVHARQVVQGSTSSPARWLSLFLGYECGFLDARIW